MLCRPCNDLWQRHAAHSHTRRIRNVSACGCDCGCGFGFIALAFGTFSIIIINSLLLAFAIGVKLCLSWGVIFRWAGLLAHLRNFLAVNCPCAFACRCLVVVVAVVFSCSCFKWFFSARVRALVVSFLFFLIFFFCFSFSWFFFFACFPLCHFAQRQLLTFNDAALYFNTLCLLGSYPALPCQLPIQHVP